jgi:2-dehydro-3-deoxyphosphogluconate aldolase/(4S)-4-hydroxy-2-oxoglutarate aldolase
LLLTPTFIENEALPFIETAKARKSRGSWVKVPLPQIPLIATGGVNQSTAFEFILAGVSAIGVGTELLPKEALQFRQEHRIHELARRFIAMVKEAREQRESI